MRVSSIVDKEGEKKMGFRIKEIREEKNMSVAELAERAGVSRQQIYNLEGEKENDPKITTLMKIADALETTIDKIFFRESD